MYKISTCGIGFVLSAPEKDALQIVKEVKNAAIIGRVERGEARIHVTSAFTGKTIVL